MAAEREAYQLAIDLLLEVASEEDLQKTVRVLVGCVSSAAGVGCRVADHQKDKLGLGTGLTFVMPSWFVIRSLRAGTR